jgi:glycosyltransferase involved in cell wall biosynthesis
MPFFSVIIPVYNRAYMLVNTLQSVKEQSFTDWECIVVDDGSTDNTKEIIMHECSNDNRIRYVYQKNAERSAARNKGVSIATGKYICFLDSDDLYKSSHLKVLHDAISNRKNPDALYFTNYEVVQGGIYTSMNTSPLTTDPTEYFFRNAVIPARVCIHSDILKKEKFDEDIVIVEDTILWVRIAQNFDVVYIAEDTVIYNLHEDNSINIKNNSSLKRMNGLKTFFDRYPAIKEKISRSLLQQLMGDTYFGIAKHYIYKKQKMSAIKNLMLSVFYRRFHPQLKHKIYLMVQLIFNKEIKQYQ